MAVRCGPDAGIGENGPAEMPASNSPALAPLLPVEDHLKRFDTPDEPLHRRTSAAAEPTDSPQTLTVSCVEG
jgi:hypothetical protein